MSSKEINNENSKESSKKSKYDLKWIYRQTKGTRFYLLLLAVSAVFTAVVTVSLAFFLKAFTDIATGVLEQSLLTTGLVATAVIVGGGIFMVTDAVLAQYITGRTERKARMDLMEVILTRRLADISKQHTGELLTKLTVDVLAVSSCFVLIVRKMIGSVIMAVMAVAAMFWLNWKMALIMLLLSPLLMAVTGLLAGPMKKASADDKKNDEVNRSIMQEDLSRIMLIKAYFMQDKAAGKMWDAYGRKLKSGVKVGFFEGTLAFSGSSVSSVMFMVALGIGAYFVMTGETTLGNLIGIIQLLNFVVMPISDFAGAVSLVSQAVASAERIGTIYGLPADKKLVIGKPVEATELIAEHISFAYQNDENGADTIFRDINVKFESKT